MSRHQRELRRQTLDDENDDAAQSRNRWTLLTTAAFVLALALVIARATMLEIIRDPFEVVPNSPGVPRGPGASAGLVLDLLCWLPAILVLVRRVFDPGFRILRAWSFVPLGILGIWALASTSWSSDRFAAMVQAFHLLSAFVLMWSAAQLVRDWLHLRVVAATCVGLLLVLVVNGMIYRFVELPDLRRSWEQEGEKIIGERGWERDSFQAKQFEKKVTGGEMVGFGASPNTLAATLTMFILVGAGVIIQRTIFRDDSGFAGIIGVAIAGGLWVMWYTGSRAGAGSLMLGALCIGAIALLGDGLAKRARMYYWTSIAVIVVGIVAIVGHGIKHGSLVHDSLTFRWQYWVGSADLYEAHPLTGVGWSNFGNAYLAHRLPIASEEIKDPHNFFVRVFVELGLVGGVLLIAWLLRLWWELSPPTTPIEDPQPTPALTAADPTIRLLAAIAILGTVINIAASIDTEQIAAYVFIEVMKRALYLCMLIIGMIAVALRTIKSQELDTRRSEWMLYGAIVAIGVFLVHNLIDFSMFEMGPMFIFAMLVGSALGMRLAASAKHSEDMVTEGDHAAKSAAGVGLGIVGLGWLAALALLVAPVIVAESRALAGDQLLRENRSADAGRLLEEAFDALPSNADYAFRAARARMYEQAAPARVKVLLNKAIEANPSAPEAYLLRAQYELAQPNPNRSSVLSDLKRVLEINPQDVFVRLQYAAVLEQFGDAEEAKRQLDVARQANEALEVENPKRLKPERFDREFEQAKARLSQRK